MYALGKLPAQPGAIQLKLAHYLNASELPTPPMVFGRPELIKNWRMLGNDAVGDCVFAGGAHETMLWNASGGRRPPVYSDASVISDYSAVTGYVPGDSSTDRGTMVLDAAKYRRDTGLLDSVGKRHKVAAYAEMHNRDLDQLALATFLLGAVGVGVVLPKSCFAQLEAGEPWDVTADEETVGGHYIPCIGRNSRGHFLFVTWGKLQAATPAWLHKYQDEGVAYFSEEWLRGDRTQRGFDAERLREDLDVVTA